MSSPAYLSALCPDRRRFLTGLVSFSAALGLPRIASAAGARDPRLLVIILRGAIDGLSAAPPVGDPDYAGLRPNIAIPGSGEGAALGIDGMFGLHPAFTNLHAMVKAKEGLVVHAVATPYRDRSHFDGQDVLESGAAGPGSTATGWLNRAVGAMPKGGAVDPKGLGVGATMPLILRGPAPALSWAPPRLDTARADTVERLGALYAARDPELAAAFAAGVATDRMASAGGAETTEQGKGGGPSARLQRSFIQIAEGAARIMADPQGPRVAAMSYDGWDTHSAEGASTGRLAQLIGALDGALGALKAGLQSAWGDTVVIVVTEFGRTARENGGKGTDHGNGTTAFLAGGAVNGGRVLADWPGLAQGSLLDGRDLKPTLDLRAVFKGIIGPHLGIAASAIDKDIFPGSGSAAAVEGLVR
jgi:uncharacterized protein (DUF1501 family)